MRKRLFVLLLVLLVIAVVVTFALYVNIKTAEPAVQTIGDSSAGSLAVADNRKKEKYPFWPVHYVPLTEASIDHLREQFCAALPAGFMRVKNDKGACTEYSISGANVLFDGSDIPGIATTTFHAIGTTLAFATDGKFVLYWGRVIDGADPDTFEPLYDVNGDETHFAYDMNYFYAGNAQIPEMRPLGTSSPMYLPSWPAKYGMEAIPALEDTPNK